MIEKPTGGIDEYDMLNRLVQDEQAIRAHTAAIAQATPWGVGRCRMAAIIAAEALRHGWQRDAERRAIFFARTGWGE